MISKKTFMAAALGGAVTLLLAGCSTSSTSNVAAGAVSESATASPTPTPTTVEALPFNAGGYLGGNATPTVDAGEVGKVSVVATAPLDSDGIGSGTLAFAFRNNTSAPISHVDFTGTATASGKVVASGSSQDTIPAQVQPGEAGFGYIYFEDTSSIPESGVQYDFKASTSPANTSSYNTAPLTVTQADNNGTSIIGTAANKTGKPLTGPYSVGIYCFNGDALSASTLDYATETGDIEADATVSFSHDLYDTPCDTFAIGVSGWFQ
ncbi:hypothetical protein EDF24_2605 [Curtobacterium sp. PhB130]|uniref:hypothetical protein n=1 Tax=Curtobacterium sp. PhB130 TaxID=2485178 RepID=UPI000F4CC2B3|nr:hypothetical protein [Curtobacterium sp. PhB130]ROS75163.1 hypothetical protein EDF24_2605 [Curtobacterium sp. PhB130]